jgi:hypothetical protein
MEPPARSAARPNHGGGRCGCARDGHVDGGLHVQPAPLNNFLRALAQRETEAFGPLIKRVQTELHATLVMVEHDLPLILAISDRVYCLEAGAVIAEGTPARCGPTFCVASAHW